MNNIIPYYNYLENCNGAFITPTNEILFVNGNHENFSMNYCLGEYYHFLKNIKSNYPCYPFIDFKENYNFDGNIEDIDLYISSYLNKEQLDLYKLWEKLHQFDCKTFYTDFLVCIIGFEKVENILKKTITTTTNNPHIKFYNYYLMDWNIIHQPKIIYNQELNIFEQEKNNHWYQNSYQEREYEYEISEIKSKVRKKDRHYFFK